MFAVGETIRDTASSGAGLWILALFFLGISAMIYLTMREAGLHRSHGAAARGRLVRGQKRQEYPAAPPHERISPFSRLAVSINAWLRGPDFRDIFLPSPEKDFRNRLRSEIDRLVGKEVYHGHKEQL